MSKEFEPQQQVTLNETIRGYSSVELVEKCGHHWIARTSSGMEVMVYEDEFDVD